MLGFKTLWAQIKELMREGKSLMDRVTDLKASFSDTPETEELIERISATENGEFLLNSGILTPEELADLSRPQKAKFLLDGTAAIETLGKEFYTEMVPHARPKLLKKLAKQKNRRKPGGA